MGGEAISVASTVPVNCTSSEARKLEPAEALFCCSEDGKESDRESESICTRSEESFEPFGDGDPSSDSEVSNSSLGGVSNSSFGVTTSSSSTPGTSTGVSGDSQNPLPSRRRCRCVTNANGVECECSHSSCSVSKA